MATLFWLKNLLLIALLLGLIGNFLFWILDPNTLPIKEIHIKGNLHTNSQDVHKIVENYATSGFFRVDVQMIRTTMLTLPWVKNIEVQRIWPETLFINIQEYKVIARWQDITSEYKKDSYVDRMGNILKLPDDRFNTQNQSLPVFKGITSTVQKILTRYNGLKSQIESVGLQIHEIGHNKQQAWTMVLDNGVKLRLGRLNNNLLSFLKIYKLDKQHNTLFDLLKSGKKSVAYIDLRYTNGIAIRVNSTAE